MRLQVALGHELLVRTHDDAARHRQVGGEAPRRGQTCAGGKPPAAHRVAQRVGEPVGQCPGAARPEVAELDVEARIGPVDHGLGGLGHGTSLA
ncbi:hypothetical protein BJF90_17480 [Pseudonocardia sp. CNS-004]|nr:hypothetical protein BJF90_17480 [Pseudonocardia sp. CNS-004]